MPREGVSYEAVAAAAEALQAAGDKPHVRSVRERLGGTGSPNTIHRHLLRWRLEQPLSSQEAQFPETLLSALQEECARRERLCAERSEERFRDSLQELTELYETAEREGEQLKEALDVLRQERDTLNGKAAERAETLTRQERLLETLHAERLEFARQLEQAHQAREHLESATAALKNSLEKARNEAQVLHEALHKKEQECLTERCEHSSLKRAESTWAEELNRLREKDLAGTAELKALSSRIESLNTELLGKTERLARTEGELKLTQQACAHTEEKLLQATEALKQHRASAIALEAENRELRAALQRHPDT